MKFYNKIISLLLSVLMLFGGTGVPLCALADENAEAAQTQSGDYADMLSYFREHMKNREEDIKYNFVTADGKYDTLYKHMLADNNFGNELNRQIFFDVFKNGGDDPYLNDYLYNSLYHQITNFDSKVNENSGTYTFKIEFRFEYYTNVEQESYVSNFVDNFNKEYIADNMSDYMKVKTIYDFIVRNTEYNEEVKEMDPNNEKNPLTPEQEQQYKIAHSAYGAICGNKLKSGEKDSDYAIAAKDKTTLSGEKILDECRQGLAVCEGYSKLFYALCISNNIPCRIVRGDYTDKYNPAPGKSKKDPHEWNYVWLNDSVKPDGARWYIVDTTQAAINSFPKADINNYNYFLRGSGNINFSEGKHQQPYTFRNAGSESGKNQIDELFDWYAPENLSSKEDYEFKNNSNIASEADSGFTVKRTAEIKDDNIEQIEFIRYSSSDGLNGKNIAFDTNEKNAEKVNVDGFDYTGIDSSFDVYVPYMIGDEYEHKLYDKSGKEIERAKNVGEYYFELKSSNGTSVRLPFKLAPRDMSKFDGNYDKKKSNIEEEYPYIGNPIEVATRIVDGFGNELQYGKDYSLEYKKNGVTIDAKDIKDMGDYTCDISFFGNYCGVYPLAFKVGKIDFSKIKSDTMEFTYCPEPARIKQGIYTPADMYRAGVAGFKIGDFNINIDKDFSVGYDGSWTAKGGEIILTGLSGSSLVEAGTQMKIKYTVKPYDISSYNGEIYDNGIYTYNGAKILPKGASGVTLLEKGVDYKIVSYSNNVNAGEAKVTIQGIGGCTGKAVLTYLIRPKNIAKTKLSNLKCTSAGKFSYTVKDGSKTLKYGTDYTQKVAKTSSGYRLTISGKGNYNSSISINVVVKTATKPKKVKAPSVRTPNLKSVKSSKKKTLVASWSKPGGSISGYYLEYSTSSNFKNGRKSVKINGAKRISCTVKGLKYKKKYYVRVRTFYKKGKTTYYSKWSKVKSVKVK